MKIILASKSPRRKEILSLITEDFTIMNADVDERAAEEKYAGPASGLSEELAYLKAKAVFESLAPDLQEEAVVIGSDTSVIIDDEILGKPSDRNDAVSMLTKLTGRTHQVATGVALISAKGEKRFTDITDVTFIDDSPYMRDLIEKYCDTDEPYDKAGSYGIQGKGALLVKSISGDFFSVMGLPAAPLAYELNKLKY